MKKLCLAPWSWAALSLGLTACTSGGDGYGLSTEPVTITAANATAVAEVAPTALGLIAFEEMMSFEDLTDEVGTVACPSGGSITAGFDIDTAPIGTLSTGDLFSVEFDNCRLDGSSRLVGGMSIDFEEINGDWEADPVWDATVELTLDDLTFSAGGASGSFDGGWTQSATYDNGDATFSLVGGFTTTLSDGSETEAASLTDLTLTCAYEIAAGESTYTIDGDFASTDLGGSITIETLTPVVMDDGAENPKSGVLRATGEDGSQLTLTILDETSVRLDVDLNGDATTDVTLNVDWSDLD